MHGSYSASALHLAINFVHNARMSDWPDEIHAVLLRLNGYMNRPDLDQTFLARAGVKLDRALFPLLTRIGHSHPIGVGVSPNHNVRLLRFAQRQRHR